MLLRLTSGKGCWFPHDRPVTLPSMNDQRPTRVRHLVLGALCSLACLTYFDRICIMQVQNDISRDLHFNQLTARDEEQLRAEGKQNDVEARAKLENARANERMSFVFLAFIVGYGLMEIPGGWLGDTWGPRAVIFRIVVIWSIFTALTGSVDGIVSWFVSNPEPGILLGVMILVRFVFGLGEAGAYPNIGRVLARWFPFRDRAVAQSFIWFSSRIGGAISPAIIGELARVAGGWRQAFWVLGGVGVAWAFFFYFWFRDRPEEKAAVNQAEADLIRSDATVGSIHDESTHGDVPWRRLFFSTNIWALNLTSACVSFCWYFNVTFLPKYLEEQFGVSFENSRWFSGSPLLVGAAGCLLGGWASDYLIRRTGSRRWGRSLLGLCGFGVAGLVTLCIPGLPDYKLVIVALCIVSAFQDLAIPCIWTVCADIGERFAATVAGCMNCVGAVGSILGIYLAPRLAHEFGWNRVFVVNGCLYLVGARLWLRINATERLSPQPTITPSPALPSEDSGSRLNREATPLPGVSTHPAVLTIPSAHPATADDPAKLP
ncbi:MAG TPA: MFS transporter [Gemmataceae bacterium]